MARMRIDVLSLFPDFFPPYLDRSILGRAQGAGHLTVQLHNIRDFAEGRHRVTDEPPYGGGGGMVLKPEPIFSAVEATVLDGQVDLPDTRPRIILMSPQGRVLTHAVAAELSHQPWLLLICGRYEGVDERVIESLVDDEISIGDYVLTGGELPALVLIDTVARLLPGVLGAADAAVFDSYATGLLEGPHYTHPEIYRGLAIPAVVRTGHEKNIRRWRRQEALRRTWQRRPDLLLSAALDEEDKWYLMKLANEWGESSDGRS